MTRQMTMVPMVESLFCRRKEDFLSSYFLNDIQMKRMYNSSHKHFLIEKHYI